MKPQTVNASAKKRARRRAEESQLMVTNMRTTNEEGKRILNSEAIYKANMARSSFMSRYSGGTADLYNYDLEVWYIWCYSQGLSPLEVKRPHLEEFSKYLQEEKNNSPRSTCRRLQTLRSFYRLCACDELIPYDPTVMLKMPKWDVDPSSIASLTSQQVGSLMAAAKERSDQEYLLICLMAMLGLRVSEACSVLIENISFDSMGYYTLKVMRKGGRYGVMPIPFPLLRLIEKVKGSREDGPLILTKSGNPQNRRGAYDWFKRCLRDAGLPENAHPHTLRHAAITALIDAGEPMHKVQEFADHRDIRTTEHYYRRTSNLDQHSAHVTARIFAMNSSH